MVEVKAYKVTLTDLEELLNSSLPKNTKFMIKICTDEDNYVYFRFISSFKNPAQVEKQILKFINQNYINLTENDIELEFNSFTKVWQTNYWDIKELYYFIKQILGFDWDYWIPSGNSEIKEIIISDFVII